MNIHLDTRYAYLKIEKRFNNRNVRSNEMKFLECDMYIHLHRPKDSSRDVKYIFFFAHNPIQ